ncbi:glycosyltransferase family 61 protein [Natronobacterium texcoconense]|uniref:Glycosyltransferase 61 catalytic domain-containing protein n=1 Tax=Natronobacterium texcoconense TaxID=1095778 RepID=A0A1H1GHQ7_NATTX|nr:glycosyltransferase family 61 protein [Natronobacterium texcoconense]SDR12376.1 Protein of unknown function [Natronobacterium texcoconense]
MSAIGLLQRALRKYKQDGVRSFLKEGKYSFFESKPVRSVLRYQILEKNGMKPIVYDDLPELSQPVDTIWEVFDDDQRAAVPDPIPPKTRISKTRSFDQVETHSPVSPIVIEIRDCRLLHPFGLTLCEQGVLPETIAKSTSPSSRVGKALSKSVSDHGYREVDNFISGQYPDSLESLPVATPLLPLWGNYYHWTIECLPRLAGVERHQNKTGVKPTIIIPENPSSWMLESLELLGIDDDRLHPLEDHCTVDQLVVPTHPGPTVAECEWVRDQMHDAVDYPTIANDTANNRIYISRRNATRRRVKNEREVADLLRSRGFDRYVLEELSVSDQIALFANAEVIIAPHGAGLANIVYSEFSSIIELFGDSKKTTFYRLAELLGHDYQYTHNPTKFGDIVVNLERLEQCLTKAGLEE